MLRSNSGVVTAVVLLAALLLLPTVLSAQTAASVSEDVQKTYGAAEARKVSKREKRWITSDHSKHEALKQEFKSGPEVTAACLTCHNEAAQQIHKTIHWTWMCPADESKTMGKAGKTLNNFCVAVPSNEPRCTSCHAGYGWKDKNFDLTSEVNVDCLVCHDQTGTYKKFPTMAGNPVSEPTPFDGKTFMPPDWNKVAQSVGRPTRDNCGTCHFYGGGGDGVKHGDLDSSIHKPTKDLDVHMAVDGADFSCVRCHTTEAHSIAGRCYKKPAATDRRSLVDDDMISRIGCESCHTLTPHEPGHKANDHTDMVACQTCHIPAMARVKPTKLWWDWSKAGKKKDGKPYTEKGELGQNIYDSKKGEFIWAKNVQPEYRWFNGEIYYKTLDDVIDPTKPVQLNWPVGSRGDERSRIYPFKVHRGKQPFDAGQNKMVVPHLFGKDKNAYWKSYDWQNAVQAGMDYVGLPFSGKLGFVETEYYYPTTHMVAPKDNALQCGACHSQDGRLANLAGFYMPGRDHSNTLDMFGWLLVIGSVGGVGIHGVMRVISRKKREEGHE